MLRKDPDQMYEMTDPKTILLVDPNSQNQDRDQNVT
jgi:hypothetical protein